MEACADTPVRRPANPSSPTPSASSLRQWRPAAQRNLRNQWSRLFAAKARWLAAAAEGRSHASVLVNAHLSRSYMPGMDLGMLKDMPGIRDRASAKLAHKEVQCREMLVSTYNEMGMVEELQYSNGSPSQNLMEDLAQELVAMFLSELQLKRFVVLELQSINLKESSDPSLEWSDELYDGELYKYPRTGLGSGDSCPLPGNWKPDVLHARRLPGHTPSHEVLQVCLTSWLANANIKMSRIDEILELVEDEMQIKLC